MGVPGATLRYVVEGDGVPALVLGSARYYPRTFSPRLRARLRMAFVDLRHFAAAHGASPAPLTLESYLADIETLRVALDLERAVLIGHSHHGNLALEYAKRHPQRVSHLVLIASPPVDVPATRAAGEAYWRAHASAERRAALHRNHARLAPQVSAGLPERDAFVAHYVADGPKYWFDPHYDATSLWAGVPIAMEALAAFRALFQHRTMAWDPEAMPAPVLAVAGRHDYVVPPALWDAARATLPPLSFHLFERSGHTPQHEEPASFDRVLMNWLGVTPPRREG